MDLPDGAAISRPVCAPDLNRLIEPNLEEILPESGLERDTPNAIFAFESLRDVETFVFFFAEYSFLATVIGFSL